MIKHIISLAAVALVFSAVSAEAGPRIYVSTGCRSVVVRPQPVYFYNSSRFVSCRPVYRQPVYYQPVYRPVIYTQPRFCTTRVIRTGSYRWR